MGMAEVQEMLSRWPAPGPGGDCVDTVALDPSITARLADRLKHIKEDPYSRDRAEQHRFVARAAKVVRRVLPKEVRQRLLAVQKPGHRGIIVVTGLPVDEDLGPTPCDGLQPKPGRKTFVAEGVHVGVAQLLGQVYTLEVDKGRHLVHTVAPVVGNEGLRASTGSTEGFGMHVEARAHPFAPEALVLTCLRSDHERKAVTKVASVYDVLPQLCQDEDTLRTLQQPLFETGMPEAYQREGLHGTSPGPVLYFEADGRPTLNINMNTMKVSNPAAQRALDVLLKLLDQTCTDSRLQPGEMVLLNNTCALHTRSTGFQVRGDGADRWLIRSFVHSAPPATIIPQDRKEWNDIAEFRRVHRM